MNLNLLKKKLKHIALNIGIGRIVYNRYVRFVKSRAKKALQKYGYDVLKDVHRILHSKGYPYFCDFGMLLGFVRDGGFMAHDDDIDFSIHASSVDKEFLDVLLENGYKFLRAFEFESRLTELSFLKYGISIDFFFYFDEGHSSCYYCYMPDSSLPFDDPNWLVRKAVRPRLGEIITYEINGVQTQIVKNYEEMLAAHYGDWRTPNPNWDYTTDPLRTTLPGHARVIGLERVRDLLY